MNSLSTEILVQIFANLATADLVEVGKTCSTWNNLLRDDQVWRNSFLHLFKALPANNVKSYRSEFIRRFRRRRVWSELGNRQMACYRFRDLGGVRGARLAPDSRALTIVTGEALVFGRLQDDAHLQRSLQYYPAAIDGGSQDNVSDAETFQVSTVKLGPKQELAIGHEDGSVHLYQRASPGTSLGKGFTRLRAPLNPRENALLPVQRIEWLSPSRLSVLCRRGSFPTSRLYIWKITPSDLPRLEHCIEGMDLVDWCVLGEADGGDIIWTDRTTIKSSQKGWCTRCPMEVDTLLPFKGRIVATGLDGGAGSMLILNPIDGTIEETMAPSRAGSALTCLNRVVSDKGGERCLLLADEEGIMYRVSAEGDDPKHTLCLTQIGSVGMRILDIAGDQTIIMAVGGDSLCIFDALGLQPLRTLYIPGKMRRASGPDLDFNGNLHASILYFDPRGRVLIQWGSRSLHLWNFGSHIAQMGRTTGRRGPGSDRTPRATKTEISLDLQEDLDAFNDEREEQKLVAEMRGQFGLEGMTEAEMLQYAQLLSLECNQHLPLTHPQQEGSDAELQLALRLSLQDP